MRFASRTGYKVTILLLVVSLLAVGFDADPALANTQTKTVEFPESTEQNRTQTITIPGLIRVKNVSVDTGRVNYTVNGDEITLTVSGGTPSRTDTPSKVVNEKRGPQDSPNFPSSISYDDGEYSGTLYKDGEAYEDGTRLDRKTVTVSYGRQSSTSFPVTYEYNVNGYTGTLYKDGGYYRDGTRYSYKYVTRTRGPQESTSFPDRIYVSEGGYSGYISKSGSYYLSRTEERPDSKFIGEYLPIDGKFVCDKNDARCIEEAETYGVTRPPLYIVIGSNWIGLEEYEGYSGWLYNTRCWNCRWYELSYDRSKIRYVGDIVFEGYVYGTKTVYLYSQDYAGSISKAEGPLYNQDYTGTVSKTIQQYSQNYTGTVTAPTIRYYSYVVTIEYEANGIENAEVLHVGLEIFNLDQDHNQVLREIMNVYELRARELQRRNGYIVYLKEANKIADFLRLIGANKALFKFEDVRIVRDMRNSVNRIVNCETANLNKTIGAAFRHIESIKLIDQTIGIDALPERLQEIASLRVEHQEASLKELGEMVNGAKISKSGVNHRLKKIDEIAEKIRNGEQILQ